MLKLAQQYNLINRCLFVYNSTWFSGVSEGLNREQKILNIVEVIKDIYGMEVTLGDIPNLKINITITV